MLIMHPQLVDHIFVNQPSVGCKEGIQAKAEIKSVAGSEEAAKIPRRIVCRDIKPPDIQGVLIIESMREFCEEKILNRRIFKCSLNLGVNSAIGDCREVIDIIPFIGNEEV